MRIGLIGCGEIARRGHLPALKVLKDFEVEALADLDESRAQRVAQEFGIAKVCSSPKELIQDSEVEAVVATTPPSAYREIVSMAAATGKPILLEKPLAGNLADAQFIVNKVKESGIKAGVVQNYRYFPALRDIKNRISSCSMGRPLSLHILLHIHSPLSWSLSPWKFEGIEGVLGDIGPHAIDALLWLANSETKRVFAFGNTVLPGARFLNEVFILAEFQSGLVGFIDLSFLTGQMAFRVDALGTGGRIFSDILFNQVDEQHGRSLPTSDIALLFKKFLFILKGVVSSEIFIGPLKYYQYLYPDFARFVEGANPEFPNMDVAMGTVKVIDATLKSLSTSRDSYI